MKRTLNISLLILVIMSLLVYINCKKSSDGIEYTLTVVLNGGVTGTPESGSYSYSQGEEVSYDYSLTEGYEVLTVVLDQEVVEDSGTITMDSNHTLTVYASEEKGEFQIYVATGTGVTGTPESDYYYYDAGEQIDYNFSLEDGYTNLVVRLDGLIVENPGSFIVSDNHRLFAVAEKEYYIQGTWTLNEVYEDRSNFQVTLTFAGETENGTVVDSDGGIGTYTVDGPAVEIIIEYPNVRYEYVGNFEDEDKMLGNSRRYYLAENTYKRGSWTANRDTDSSTSGAANRKNKGTW